MVLSGVMGSHPVERYLCKLNITYGRNMGGVTAWQVPGRGRAGEAVPTVNCPPGNIWWEWGGGESLGVTHDGWFPWEQHLESWSVRVSPHSRGSSQEPIGCIRFYPNIWLIFGLHGTYRSISSCLYWSYFCTLLVTYFDQIDLAYWFPTYYPLSPLIHAFWHLFLLILIK